MTSIHKSPRDIFGVKSVINGVLFAQVSRTSVRMQTHLAAAASAHHSMQQTHHHAANSRQTNMPAQNLKRGLSVADDEDHHPHHHSNGEVGGKRMLTVEEHPNVRQESAMVRPPLTRGESLPAVSLAQPFVVTTERTFKQEKHPMRTGSFDAGTAFKVNGKSSCYVVISSYLADVNDKIKRPCRDVTRIFPSRCLVRWRDVTRRYAIVLLPVRQATQSLFVQMCEELWPFTNYVVFNFNCRVPDMVIFLLTSSASANVPVSFKCDSFILFWLNPQNGLCLLCSKSPVYGFCRTMLRAANFFTKTVLIHCCIKAQHRRQKKCPIGVSIESPPVQWHFLFLQSHRGKAALYQTNLQWMHSIMNRNDATKQPTKLWPRFSHTGAAPFAAYGRIITSTTKKPNA